MSVLIFGGTGFIGRYLTEELLNSGYKVYVVTRNHGFPVKDPAIKVQFIEWNNNTPLSSIGNPKEIEAVVNLAGESIARRRWSRTVKQEILNSRVNTTRAIVTAINNKTIQPKVLISASAVGYYGPRKDEEITESEEAGKDFLAEVCRNWENEAFKTRSGFARVLTIRIGVVLGNEGALNRMALPFLFYLGGPLGTGNQWLSWIHIRDLIKAIRFAIEHGELGGPINVTAPSPIKMKDFCNTLGEVLKRPSWLPVPGFLLRAALGQMSEMLLHGQRAVPKKLIDAGFEFQHIKLRTALEDILKKRDNT